MALLSLVECADRPRRCSITLGPAFVTQAPTKDPSPHYYSCRCKFHLRINPIAAYQWQVQGKGELEDSNTSFYNLLLINCHELKALCLPLNII